MVNKLNNKFFFVQKRSNIFELLDLNDLHVEVQVGEVYLNSHIFDYQKNIWIPLSKCSFIPNEILLNAKDFDGNISMPDFVPLNVSDFMDLSAKRENNESVTEALDRLRLEHNIFADEFCKTVDSLGFFNTEIKDKVEQNFLKSIEAISVLKSLDSNIQVLNSNNKIVEENNDKIEKLNSRLKNAVMENDLLKENLKKALLKIEILQNRVNENNAPLKSTGPVVENDKVIGFEDLQKGRTYEFINALEWIIFKDQKSQGPYRFDQILEMKEKSELNDCKIKRSNELYWRDPGDILELSSRVKLIQTNPANPEKSIYLVERGEYRADVRESVTFEVNGMEYKGILSNISLSGGFIELFKTDEFESLIDKTGGLYLNQGLVKESIFCSFKLKRISKNRPKGIGFAFVNVNEKNMEIIGELITSILNRNNKIAS